MENQSIVNQLSVEASFKVNLFERTLDSLDPRDFEGLKQITKDIYRQMKLQEETYQKMLKHKWFEGDQQ